MYGFCEQHFFGIIFDVWTSHLLLLLVEWENNDRAVSSIFYVLRHPLKLSSPRGAWAFDVLKRYHTRPLQFNWGPKNVHFGKPILGTQILMIGFFLWKFKELSGATFLCFAFFTTVPKVQKTPKNYQIVIPSWRTSYIKTNACEILLNT